MNGEWVNIWKDKAVAYLKVLFWSSFGPGEMEKNNENISQENSLVTT